MSGKQGKVSDNEKFSDFSHQCNYFFTSKTYKQQTHCDEYRIMIDPKISDSHVGKIRMLKTKHGLQRHKLTTCALQEHNQYLTLQIGNVFE